MSRWNFDKHNTRDLNGKYINANRPLDTNPDHYKTKTSVKRQRDERIADPSKNYQKKYVEGTVFHFVGGGVYKTEEFTVAAFTQLMKDRFESDKSTSPYWLEMKNGGMIQLDNVTYFEPWRFYEYHNNRGER